MKFRFPLIPILAATLVLSSNLRAEKSAELQKQLEEITQLLTPAESDTPEIKISKSEISGLVENFHKQMNQEQVRDFAISLGHSSGQLNIPGLVEKLDKIRLTAQQEILRRQEAKLAEGEALIKEVGDLLQSAKKPEELDGMLLKLSQLKISDYNEDPKLALIGRQVQTVAQIVGNWQEYLIAKETGNFCGY